MTKNLTERGYKQVALPTAMMEDVEEWRERHPEKGFSSNPEVIRTAIRIYLKENE